VPCAQLYFVDDACEATVHQAALRRWRAGIHTAGQQRMREPDPIAFDGDDAVAFGSIEQLDHPVMVGVRRFGDQLDGGSGYAGGGKKYVLDSWIQAADPGANQLSQRAGQYITSIIG
jgi:hypothetical protein